MKRISPIPKGKSKLPPIRKRLGQGSDYEDNMNNSLDPYLIVNLRDSSESSEMNFHVRTPENIIISVELNHTVQFSEMYLINRQREFYQFDNRVQSGIHKNLSHVNWR